MKPLRSNQPSPRGASTAAAQLKAHLRGDPLPFPGDTDTFKPRVISVAASDDSSGAGSGSDSDSDSDSGGDASAPVAAAAAAAAAADAAAPENRAIVDLARDGGKLAKQVRESDADACLSSHPNFSPLNRANGGKRAKQVRESDADVRLSH